MRYCILVVFLCACLATLHGQHGNHSPACGSDHIVQTLRETDSEYSEKENGLEKQYRKAAKGLKKSSGSGICLLPVVVHVIHENGNENISDEQVMTALEYLNDAFRNNGYFNPATGVDTEIGFCLAQRTPEGNPTNGIVRYQSPLTDMSTPHTHNEVAALATWDPNSYINIRLIKEACIGGSCATAGYAFSPASHGWAGDGIVMEAGYFGPEPENSTVLVHEMGHYLGLLHTFAGGCSNGDCLGQGDRVCDTPPDNLTGPFACDIDFNSCSTDEDDPSNNNPFRQPSLGGMGDQPDQHRNHLDYGFQFCRDRFTEGQKERMHFFIQNVRSSLLQSKACLLPCPDEPVALFSIDNDMPEPGEPLNITNLSENADGFSWYINGVLVSQAVDTIFTFNEEGEYFISLEATSSAMECGADEFGLSVTVTCPVTADFAYALNGDRLVFDDLSINANDLQWTVKDVAGNSLLSSLGSTDSVSTVGQEYLQLCLVASNLFCDDQHCEYIQLAVDGTEICNNGIDDDSDGLVDHFDPDCPCGDEFYQAFCPVDCEYVPDEFPSIELKLKWTSEIIANSKTYCPNIVAGDIDGDGGIDILSRKSVGDHLADDVANNTLVVDGGGGDTALDFNFLPDSSTYIYSMVSIADVDTDGKAEIFSVHLDTVLCHSHDGKLLWKSDKLSEHRGFFCQHCRLQWGRNP